MKEFVFTMEPSELHKDLIMRQEEHFSDICSQGQINYKVLGGIQRWERWNSMGHLFKERPEILDEVQGVATYLQVKWTHQDGTLDKKALTRWLSVNAEELEPEEDDDADDEAYAFYLETDLALYTMIVDMSEAYPELAIFAQDKRYLGTEREARKHLAELAGKSGDLAFAREACYYLLSQLPDSEKMKLKLARTINTLNIILSG